MNVVSHIEPALVRIRGFVSGNTREPLVTVCNRPDYRQEPDRERMVARACEVIQADLASGEPDVLPSFFPDFGTVSTAAIYGGKRIPARHGGCVHIEPAARSLDELLSLRPCAFEESDYQRALDIHAQVCERLGTGEVLLRTPDFQGPLNTLALLIDQTELMVGMTENPGLIGTMLDRITDTLIAFTIRYREAVGAHRVIGSIWPFTVLPDGVGVSIVQDYMPLLGPEHYARFELPRLKRIADAFGGVQIHCCGAYAHHLPALQASGIPVLGLEFHHPFTSFRAVHDVFGDSIFYVPYLFGACKDYAGYSDFAVDLLRQGTGSTRFWFAMAREWVDGAALRNALSRQLAVNADRAPGAEPARVPIRSGS